MTSPKLHSRIWFKRREEDGEKIHSLIQNMQLVITSLPNSKAIRQWQNFRDQKVIIVLDPWRSQATALNCLSISAIDRMVFFRINISLSLDKYYW